MGLIGLLFFYLDARRSLHFGKWNESGLFYSLDSSKVKRLGWKITSKFEETISQTVDWYVQNRPWWERLLQKQDSFKSKWYKGR